MLRRYQIRGRRVPVPSVSTVKAQTQPIDYKKGLYSGIPNDLQPKGTLPYITDKRFSGVGKYKTRQGCDRYSVPIGEAVNVQVTSTTGAADAGLTTTTRIAEKVTATASGVATKAEIRIKNSASATGTVLVELYTNASNAPGVLIAQSSIAWNDITSSYAYLPVYFMQTPAITNGSSYWIVVYLQESGTGTMYVSSTTNSTNAKTSTNSGQSWSATSYSLNVKLHTSTAGGVKGLTRIYRPDGTPKTFFAHSQNLYLIDDVTGATTSVDSSINAFSTTVRFEYVNDTLYYVDGVGKPRKYNHASSSEVSASPYATSHIIEHVGLLFYVRVDDPNFLFWTNFADYETFTSTDFTYVPAPKRSDHIKALAKLNGVLYVLSRSNKHMLMGQDSATFKLDEAYAQKGTFSQESVVWDENNIYFASDDGVYKFNGTSEVNIFEPVIDEYMALNTKDDIHLQLHNNRLYVWYRPNGGASVTECFVYNTLYGVMEGKDLNTHIGRSFARHDTTDKFLQAATNAGAVYYSELSTNDYHNLGSQLAAEVRTSYDHFGSPQQKKRITYWRPVLSQVQGNYTLQAGFAADYSDDANFKNVPLQATGFTYDSPASLYDNAIYARGGTTTDTTLNIFGEAYRWQRIYKHHAAHEPVEFAGEVLRIQTRRLR